MRERETETEKDTNTQRVSCDNVGRFSENITIIFTLCPYFISFSSHRKSSSKTVSLAIPCFLCSKDITARKEMAGFFVLRKLSINDLKQQFHRSSKEQITRLNYRKYQMACCLSLQTWLPLSMQYRESNLPSILPWLPF